MQGIMWKRRISCKTGQILAYIDNCVGYTTKFNLNICHVSYAVIYMLVFIFLTIFPAIFVNASTVHGTVYDISLKRVSNARVEIDTVPKQFMISANGTYSFEVPGGKYSIKAVLMQKRTIIASALENITINQDGNYVLDLLLFPEIEEGIEQPDIEINSDIITGTSNKRAVNILLIFIAALAVFSVLGAALYYKKLKKLGKKEEMPIAKAKDMPEYKLEESHEDSEERDLEQIIKLLRREGGRATQKEIRKFIPLSEAKISLMIAELEHKGAIEKIKKGRGNIIILKKK